MFIIIDQKQINHNSIAEFNPVVTAWSCHKKHKAWILHNVVDYSCYGMSHQQGSITIIVYTIALLTTWSISDKRLSYIDQQGSLYHCRVIIYLLIDLDTIAN